MDISKQDKQLIDRYLCGQLTGAELDDFRKRMQEDRGFHAVVELHSLLQKGIQKSYEQHYRNLVLSSIRYRKTLIPLGLKLIFFFLFVTLSVSLLWFYLAPDTGRNAPQFSFFDNLKSGETARHKTAKKKTSVSNGQRVPGDPVRDTNDSTAGSAAAEVENGLMNDTVVSIGNGENGEIVVRKDEMLISYQVAVTNLDDDVMQDGKDELSNTAIEKLNPSAGLPEKEVAIPASILTEFWVSPVNYRGYRFLNNKLILFGIEEPDHVKFFRVKDILYMSYQNAYYRLLQDDNFVSYQRIKEAEVPLAIRSSK